ncbi:MAG: SPOR domain-containing protein, partial [Alphaproteobacteria bacterium]|nr:SPOR domain-containing protein [Alphaproteobacteria bacterium]
ARLQVGDQVPIVTQQAQSVSQEGTPLVNSVELRDTGVILSVTPRVNAGGLVIMDIEQEVSDVAPTTTSGIDSPTISTRKISSSIAVQSGETVALGGLIRESTTSTKVGLPFLHKIPLLGALFGRTEEKLERTELLVLLTPRVAGTQGEARAITEELRRRMRDLDPLFDRVNRGRSVPTAAPDVSRTEIAPLPRSRTAQQANLSEPQSAATVAPAPPTTTQQTSATAPAPPPPPRARSAPSAAELRPAIAQSAAWRVQLAALKSQQDSEAEWTRLQRANQDLLDGLTLRVQQAKLSKGTYYRLQAGPLADLATATELCKSLKSRNQDCLIVAP